MCDTHSKCENVHGWKTVNDCLSPKTDGVICVQRLAKVCGIRSNSQTKSSLCPLLIEHLTRMGLTPVQSTKVMQNTVPLINKHDDDEEVASMLAIMSLHAVKNEKQGQFVAQNLAQHTSQMHLNELKNKDNDTKSSCCPSSDVLINDGWRPLSDKHKWWRKFVMDHSDIGFPNCICERECGGGGNCLFHSIAYAMRELGITFEDLREIAASQVDETNVDLLLALWGEEQNNEDWNDNWFNPDEIQQLDNREDRIAALQQAIQTPGYYLQGDDNILNLLVHHDFFLDQKLGIILLSTDNGVICNIKGPIDTMTFRDDDTGKLVVVNEHVSERFLILVYVGKYHYRLGGVAKFTDASHGKYEIQSIVEANDIPNALKFVYTKTCRSTDDIPFMWYDPKRPLGTC